MTYQEALKQSNYLEGAIKCTYVRFYYDYGGKGNSSDIKHLFSLQNAAVAIDDMPRDKFSMSSEVVNMFTNQLGEFRVPVVEVRPSFRKEIAWGRKKPGTLVRVNVEESVLAALTDYIERYSMTGKDFTYVSDKIQRVQNLYVKADAIEWQPMGTDVLEDVVAEDAIANDEQIKMQREKVTKSKSRLLLMAAASLLLNQL